MIFQKLFQKFHAHRLESFKIARKLVLIFKLLTYLLI